jgi:hypothetical protein
MFFNDMPLRLSDECTANAAIIPHASIAGGPRSGFRGPKPDWQGTIHRGIGQTQDLAGVESRDSGCGADFAYFP